MLGGLSSSADSAVSFAIRSRAAPAGVVTCALRASSRWVEEIRVIAATSQQSVTLKYGEYAYAP